MSKKQREESGDADVLTLLNRQNRFVINVGTIFSLIIVQIY